MTHNILQANKIMAESVDSLVRPAVSGSALDNGNIGELLTKSALSGNSEVWNFTAPRSASPVNGVWMVMEAEVPFLASAAGNVYNGLGTIQDFYVSASKVFTAYKPQIGDIITVTADALDSGTANNFVVPVLGAFKMAWSSTIGLGFCYKYVNTTFFPSADGSIGTGRIIGFQLECVQI